MTETMTNHSTKLMTCEERAAEIFRYIFGANEIDEFSESHIFTGKGLQTEDVKSKILKHLNAACEQAKAEAAQAAVKAERERVLEICKKTQNKRTLISLKDPSSKYPDITPVFYAGYDSAINIIISATKRGKNE